MSEVVREFHYDGLFTLKVIGRNDGRYAAYCDRIGAALDSPESYVDEATPWGAAKVKPAFYETRYFVRCDFKDPAVRDAFVNHKMSSVAEAFDFDGKTLVGTLDFVNSPGKFRFEVVWYRNGIRESAAFDWMVVSEKLTVQSDYTEIVSKIEESAPGLVRAFLAKSKGQAGLINRDDTNDARWGQALWPISVNV